MSNLAFSKEWLFNVNNMTHWLIAGATAINQRAVWLIKEVLKGGNGNNRYGWTAKDGTSVTAPTFWTVDHSCDSTIAGTPGDGVDRLSDDTKLVWGSAVAVNSWIVLHNSTAGIYWLINCENSASDTNLLDMWVSKVGFGAVHGGTDGTTSTRPTATDEQNMLASTYWGAGSGTIPIRFHIMMSNDGMATRVFITRSMSLHGTWFIEPLGDPVVNLENNILAVAKGGTLGNALDFQTSFSQTAIPLARKTGGPTINGIFTIEGSRYVGSVNTAAALVDRMFWNDIAQKNSVFAINVLGIGYPSRGKIGTIIDLWATSDLIAGGRTWPGDHSRQLVALGPFVVPWNGTIPELH